MDKLPPKNETPVRAPKEREDRLKAALKVNIARRKAQARLRDRAEDAGQSEDRAEE